MKKRSLSVLGNALFAVLTLGIGATIVALTVLPPVLGYQTYVVLSGSMEPAIHTGSVIVSMGVNPNALQIGDVITYIRPGDQENITHRIVTIKGNSDGRTFITKGDANNVEDPGEVHYDRLAGKVTMAIPYLGYFFKFVGSPQMRLLLIVIPGLLLLGSWLWEVWRPQPKAPAGAEPVPTGMAPQPVSSPRRPANAPPNLELGIMPDAATAPLRQ